MDNDGYMVNDSIVPTPAMCEEINIPIICLDDDDDDEDDPKTDKEYKLFLDHLRDGISLGPLFKTTVNYLRYEVEESVTRKFDIISGDSRHRKENVSVVGRKQETESNKRVSSQHRKSVELKAETSRTREKIERDNRVAERRMRKRIFEFEASRRDKKSVRVVNAQEDIQRDKNVSQERKRKIAETRKAAGTSRDGPVVETLRTILVSKRSKNEDKSVVKVDKDYKSYLTWLVESTTCKSMEPPMKMKEEIVDLQPSSDDSDIIAVSDSPFLDGEGRSFVASKSAINLEEESKDDDESGGCLFRKELMDVVGKPYDEGELLRLSKEVSRKRLVTRCRELRKGREKDYKTEEWGPSYLESHSDFHREYKLVEGAADKAKALKLLRGFFFYLVNVCRDGAFKPWEKFKI